MLSYLSLSDFMFNLNLALVVISDHVGERKKEENVFVMGGVFMVAEIVGDLIPFSLAKVCSGGNQGRSKLLHNQWWEPTLWLLQLL